MHDIRLTNNALAKAKELRKTPSNEDMSLRLYLEGKGCDGFYYGVTFDNEESNDLVGIQEGLPIIVDPETYLFCKGSEIEWVDDERGAGFLVNNPQHRKFRGKFYKRSAWQEALEKRTNS